MDKKQIKSINNAISFIAMVATHGYKDGDYNKTIEYLKELNLELPQEVIEHMETIISKLQK